MAAIPRIQVVGSSNIASIGYDGEVQVVEVEFSGGRVYHYLGVDPAAWASQHEYDSIGRWVARYLKPNHEAVVGAYEPVGCGAEHDWPADIESDSRCETCGLAYTDWAEADG